MFIRLCIIDNVLLDSGAVRPRALLLVIFFTALLQLTLVIENVFVYRRRDKRGHIGKKLGGGGACMYYQNGSLLFGILADTMHLLNYGSTSGRS